MEKTPDRGFGAQSQQPPPALRPHPFLTATAEEITRLDRLLSEHLRTVTVSHEKFCGYLDGKMAAREWEDARRAADRARIAYERKCDAILVRTFRI